MTFLHGNSGISAGSTPAASTNPCLPSQSAIRGRLFCFSGLGFQTDSRRVVRIPSFVRVYSDKNSDNPTFTPHPGIEPDGEQGA